MLRRFRSLSTAKLHVVQMSQLAELLVYLGHGMDAAKLQEGLDAYVKAFLAAAQDVLDNPSPHANTTDKAREDSSRTLLQLQMKQHNLRKVSWKWDLLRPVKQ